jgi:hypothetical protein
VIALTLARAPKGNDRSVRTYRLTLPAHGAGELLVGLALVGLPFALSLGAAPLILAMCAGALVTGIALAGDALGLGMHQALDQAAVAGLLGAAIGLAMAGERSGALLFGAAAAAELALLSGTRWTR